MAFDGQTPPPGVPCSRRSGVADLPHQAHCCGLPSSAWSPAEFNGERIVGLQLARGPKNHVSVLELTY
jgi:hypothetical protein